MSAMQRRKGAAYERHIAHRFAHVMHGSKTEIRRGIGQSRSASEVADVDVECFWVECKRQKQANVRAALRQAVSACPAGNGKWPVAVVCDDSTCGPGKPRQDCGEFVAMRLEDFLDLVSEWWERGLR